ncbi:hydrogenase [Mangrovimicrobium sediminis]|uniref:Hydrogenase expression/formation protein n=1 Tax=Mangrovimicrobium sediminis TaxID=2562682 RepID=A0A4Z0M4N0_9GAMM|nr:hydrogenase [Haliea sp. SAOS-164]TGD74328.1 hydrogenase [Haliea sp. SAOS-164]
MPSPIVENMLERHGYPRLDEAALAPFLAAHPRAVLFFCAEPQKYPESNDVAMVLPELVKEFDGLAAAIVAADFEQALQARFDFTVWPALAFFNEGNYCGAITGIQNWEDYLQRIPALLDAADGGMIPAVNV